MKERHNYFIDKYRIKYGNLSDTLFFISSFFKEKNKYQFENEVRIIKYIEDYEELPDPYHIMDISNSVNNILKLVDLEFGKETSKEDILKITRLFEAF